MKRAVILLSALSLACGGGGAAVEPDPASSNPSNPNPSNPSSPNPSSPSAPSSTNSVVTTVGTSFSPANIAIAPGSTVTWQIAGGTHNVTFGSSKPTGGDIPDTGAGSNVSRTFPSAGTFDYQCTRHSGMTGRVTVSADGSTPAPTNPSPSEGTIVQATTSAFTPERVEITAGGIVTWDIAAGAGGIVFDDASPAGGNIPESAAAARVSRTFTVQGDYDYHNSRNGDIKGRIRVR